MILTRCQLGDRQLGHIHTADYLGMSTKQKFENINLMRMLVLSCYLNFVLCLTMVAYSKLKIKLILQ